jgi:hypothetical protein
MTKLARMIFQVLWEELEKYRSDHTWLEPHVQSAITIKNYVEKALYVEKLKKNVVDQELETKRQSWLLLRIILTWKETC